jgi:Spx/MgsR family transcriptional regulator
LVGWDIPMSRVRIYLYSNCSSCKNAEQVLSDAGVEYDRRDIFRERMTVPELEALFHEIGKSPTELLSRRSIPYRQLGIAERAPSDSELIELMTEHPGLLRRPIVIAAGEVQIGFNRAALESLAQRNAQD